MKSAPDKYFKFPLNWDLLLFLFFLFVVVSFGYWFAKGVCIFSEKGCLLHALNTNLTDG